MIDLGELGGAGVVMVGQPPAAAAVANLVPAVSLLLLLLPTGISVRYMTGLD